MRQTTRSHVAKEVNDFSSALLDARGAIVAQAVPYGLPFFLAGVPKIIKKWAGRLQEGDVFINNDPYGGASHLPDVLVVMPIFRQGELIGFASTFQHHTDIGGRFPGGYGTESQELYEEGLRLPGVHFYRANVAEEAVHEIIAANVRAPEDVLGDLEANAAACRRGATGMIELYDRYGADLVRSCFSHYLGQSERYMREVIAGIPDGQYQVSGTCDDGGFDIVLTLRVDGEQLVADFTGSSPQSSRSWNVPLHQAYFSIFNGLLGLLTNPDLIINEGYTRPIRVAAPKGTIVNPRFPAAVSSRTHATLLIGELMTDALAIAVPSLIPAPGSGGPQILIFTPNSTDGGPPKVFTDIWHGGWGARADADGIDGVVPIEAPGFRASSAEALDLQTDLALEGFGFVPDTAGPGKYRGTTSVFRRFRFKADGRATLRTIRTGATPPGREGGEGGSPFSATLIRDGIAQQLPRESLTVVEVKAGDVIEHILSAGSGYGDPTQRDPALVLADVLDQKVSPEQARTLYLVAIDMKTQTVDSHATNQLRGIA